MNEVSLPVRILLGVTLAFGALWFAALRPTGVETDPPLPGEPAASAPAPAGASANAAAAPAAASPAASPATKPAGASGSGASAGTARPAASTGEKRGDRSERASLPALARDLERGRVAVVLFWNGRSADDRAARDAVRALDRRGGKVSVHVARLEQIVDYAPLLGGVPVAGSPTTLVIGRDREVKPINGLTVTREIDQAVADALRSRPAS